MSIVSKVCCRMIFISAVSSVCVHVASGRGCLQDHFLRPGVICHNLASHQYIIQYKIQHKIQYIVQHIKYNISQANCTWYHLATIYEDHCILYEKAQKISTMPSVLQTLIQAPKCTPSVYMRSGGIKCAKCRFLKNLPPQKFVPWPPVMMMLQIAPLVIKYTVW